MFDNLDNANLTLYCIKAYDRPNCIMSEFEEDIKRFNYINRLFTRYNKTGEMRERLVINHLIVLCNVFGPEVTVRVAFLKISEEYYKELKTYLLFLNILPPKIRGINGRDIISSNISVNMEIVEVLRQIK